MHRWQGWIPRNDPLPVRAVTSIQMCYALLSFTASKHSLLLDHEMLEEKGAVICRSRILLLVVQCPMGTKLSSSPGTDCARFSC